MPEPIGKPPLDTSLLPFYQEWKSNETSGPTGLWDYLALESNYDLAGAFSKLFWPDFVEVEGCIFLGERYPKLKMAPERFKELIRENPPSLEFLVNNVNTAYIFADNGIGIDEQVFPQELFVYLAQVLLVCWKHALAEAFPDRKFEFFYHVEDDLVDPKITFWQVRPDSDHDHEPQQNANLTVVTATEESQN
jgi:hypothetical protein